MSILQTIKEAVIEGEAEKVKENVEKAVKEGIELKAVLNEGLVAGMSVIGERFKNHDCYTPEVLIAARAMQFGTEVLKPLLLEAGIKEKGILVIGTVKDDLHDIGKNLVIMMFEGAGYKVVDLGVDVKPEDFVKAVTEHKPDFIGISSLLTTTMGQMKETVVKLKDSGEGVKILVGGAPITPEFADAIGAKYAPDAATAVEIADQLIKV